MTRESDIEKYFVRCIKNIGGEVRKLQWVGRKDAPDRCVFYRGVHFVELKRPGKDLRPSQRREVERMRKHGASAWTISSHEGVDAFINALGCLRA